MKLATATFLLGASSVAADLTADSSGNFLHNGNTIQLLYTSGTKTLSLDGPGHETMGIVCEKRVTDDSTGALDEYAEPNASTGGADLELATQADTVVTGKHLKYSCAPKDDAGNTLSASADQPSGSIDTHGLLIEVVGACNQDGLTTVTLTENNNGNYNPSLRLYEPEVTVTETYDCIQGKDYDSTLSATVELQLEKIANIPSDIVGIQELTSAAIPLKHSADGKTFSGTKTIQFDVGTDKPHHDYYQQCDNSDLCTGALITTTTSATSGTDSASSFFSTSWTSDAKKWAFTQCSPSSDYTDANGVFIREGEFTLATICNSQPYEMNGAKTDKLECPYGAEGAYSRLAEMYTCRSKADDNTIVNRCDDHNAGVAETIGSGTYSRTFEVLAKYVGSKNGAAIVPCVLSHVPVTFSSDQTEASVTFNCAENTGVGNANLTDVTGLYLKDDTDDIYPVSKPASMGGNIEVTLPSVASNRTFTLYGLYHQAGADCNEEKAVAVSNGILFDTSRPVEVSGTFYVAGSVQAGDGSDLATNICKQRFVFKADDNAAAEFTLKATPDNYRVCTGDSQSNDQCDAGSDITFGDGDQVHLGGDICTDLPDGHLGGLVEVTNGNTLAAKIVCAGVCSQASLSSLTLDWSDDFVAGLVTDNNELIVGMDSVWGDDREDTDGPVFTSTATAYIGASDDCLADGRLALPAYKSSDGSCADKIKVTNSGEKRRDGAADTTDTLGVISENQPLEAMLTQFRECGNHPPDDQSPSVFLNQQFKIKYDDITGKTGKDAYYCNTKKLTIGVAGMEGQVEGVMTVQQNAGTEFAIAAVLQEVIVENCENDPNKFQVRVEVLMDNLNDKPFNATKTPGSPQTYNFHDDLIADRVLQWKTACKDICSDYKVDDWESSTLVSADVTHADISQLTPVEVNVAVVGNPCDRSQDIALVTPAFNLYKQTSGAGTCDITVPRDTFVSPFDTICARFDAPVELGDATLQITNEQLFRKLGDTYEVDSRTPFAGLNNLNTPIDNTGTLIGEFVTVQEDANTEFKLVVDYEQINPKRRLRATYVFGAGDDHVEATIKVLPAVQVQDELEAGDDNIVNLNEVPAPSHEHWKNENQAEKDRAQVGMHVTIIIVAGCIGLFLFFWGYKNCCQNKGNPYVFETKPATTMAGKSQYTKVRRSERFSTPKF